MSTELDLPGGDCSRQQFDALTCLLAVIRTFDGTPSSQAHVASLLRQIGKIDPTTYPIAEEHIGMCMLALEQAERHARLASYYISRGE